MDFLPDKKLGFGLMHLPIIELMQKVAAHFEH